MIALLSTIFGFLSSFAPDVVNAFKASSERKHELAMMEKQAELGLKQAIEVKETAETNAQVEEIKALSDAYKAELDAAEKSFIGKLAASVRPVLTYAFFLLYAGVKIASLTLVMNPTLPWQASVSFTQALTMVWNEEDVALFSAIMAFWFGGRLRKAASRTI